MSEDELVDSTEYDDAVSPGVHKMSRPAGNGVETSRSASTMRVMRRVRLALSVSTGFSSPSPGSSSAVSGTFEDISASDAVEEPEAADVYRTPMSLELCWTKGEPTELVRVGAKEKD